MRFAFEFREFRGNSDTVLANASVHIYDGDIKVAIITDFMVRKGRDNEIWLAPPQRSYEQNGETKWKKIAYLFPNSDNPRTQDAIVSLRDQYDNSWKQQFRDWQKSQGGSGPQAGLKGNSQLPQGWRMMETPEGKTLYISPNGQSQYLHPNATTSRDEAQQEVPVTSAEGMFGDVEIDDPTSGLLS